MDNTDERVYIDEGLTFGLGAFETIAIEQGRPQLLDWHVERLLGALQFLGIEHQQKTLVACVEDALTQQKLEQGRYALKLVATPKNLFTQTRPNVYTDQDYQRGFKLCTSTVRRNESSDFVYYKTLNSGDNITEKRKAQASGFDEPLFLNSQGYIAEGATTNVFFVRGTEIVTPPVECGLLPGVTRRLVCQRYEVCQRPVLPHELETFDAAFVTNSLLGIMPVRSIDAFEFPQLFRAEHFLRE